ncbi:hypothetical protein V6N13_081170 [Hibiscus sabdariffa]
MPQVFLSPYNPASAPSWQMLKLILQVLLFGIFISFYSTKRSISEFACWLVPSPEEYVKANFDASYCSTIQEACSEVVIRNSDGQVMGACCQRTAHVLSCFAAVHAIEVAHVIFKVSSPETVDQFWVEHVPATVVFLVVADRRWCDPP